MKKIVMAVGLLLSSYAFGADQVCGKFVDCGTFEGQGVNTVGNKRSVYYETFVIKSIADDQIHMDVYVYGKGQKAGDKGTYSLPLDLTFDQDGNYKVTNGITVDGYCVNKVCTVNDKPWTDHNQTTFANLNILRFENGTLTRDMIANHGTQGVQYQRSVLKRT